MLSRRDLVGKLAAGTAAAVCATGVTGVSFAATRGATADGRDTEPGSPQVVDADTEQAPAPWELLAPLTLGATVANGWSAAGLSGVVDGSCVLTLKNQRGREHRVHLCRNDGNPEGVVFTARFDLLVMNGGRGDLPTDEGLAQAVAEVAHVLAQNENDQQVAPMIGNLMSQSERVSHFAGTTGSHLR